MNYTQTPELKNKSDEIARQIEEFKKRGKKIQKIKSGQTEYSKSGSHKLNKKAGK